MIDQRKADADHLKLLAMCHFIMAGLVLLGLAFLFLHWFMIHTMFDHPEMWKGQPGGPPPKEFFKAFVWFYLFFGACITLASAANVVSGWLIKRRRGRLFSLVVAGLNCMIMPFGTVLGVFTFLVLLRDSVTQLYEAEAGRAAPPAPEAH